MSKETSSTIGEQRNFNYALKPMSKEDFVTMMTAGSSRRRPSTFQKTQRSIARARVDFPSCNRHKRYTRSRSSNYATKVTYCSTFAPPADFGAAHVPGSTNVGLGGQFAMWAGSLDSFERIDRS
jgi:hypothetical protein